MVPWDKLFRLGRVPSVPWVPERAPRLSLLLMGGGGRSSRAPDCVFSLQDAQRHSNWPRCAVCQRRFGWLDRIDRNIQRPGRDLGTYNDEAFAIHPLVADLDCPLARGRVCLGPRQERRTLRQVPRSAGAAAQLRTIAQAGNQQGCSSVCPTRMSNEPPRSATKRHEAHACCSTGRASDGAGCRQTVMLPQ